MTSKNNWIRVTFLIIASLFILVLCVQGFNHSQGTANDKIVKVGIVGAEDKPIWNAVNHQLTKKHIYIQTVPFSNGIQANRATNDGQLDLNAFQHYAFLKSENQQKGYHLSPIGQTYIQPLNVYSSHLRNLHNIKERSKIAIPNDSTNSGRALDVLQHAGLIKTKASKGYLPTLQDITDNPKHLQIDEVDAGAIMKLLPDFSAGITNSNFVQAAHKNPLRDSIYHISANVKYKVNHPWINIIVTKSSQKNNHIYKEVVEAYHSKSVAKVIRRLYKNTSFPAFNY